MPLHRSVCVLAACAFWIATAALAQNYPQRPIHLLLGGPPGTVLDIAGRQIAERLATAIGQPVVVENRPTAGGIVALKAVKDSAPDGYTLALVHFAQMSVAPALFERLPYDPVHDFAPVGILYTGVQVLAAHPRVPDTSWSDFVAYALAHPLRYSSPGNGTPSHVFMEQLKALAGLNVEHIPYKGPAANIAVLNGEVDLLLEGVAPMLPLIQAGKLHALAVGGSRRLPALPGVPTFAELGYRGVGEAWVGVVAPRDTPAPIVHRLNRALDQALGAPEMRASFESMGRTIAVSSPQQMTAILREEIPHWRDIVRRAGIKPD